MTEYDTIIFHCDLRMSGYVTLKSGWGILKAEYYNIVMSRFNISITLYWRTLPYSTYKIDIEHSYIRMTHVSSTLISQYNSRRPLHWSNTPKLQHFKHFGRFNKMESKIGLGHSLFEQHVSLSSLTFIYTKMSYCYVNILYHDVITISWQYTRRSGLSLWYHNVMLNHHILPL